MIEEKDIESLTQDDVGREVRVIFAKLNRSSVDLRKIQMSIQTSRHKLILFDNPEDISGQCEVIRNFMMEGE